MQLRDLFADAVRNLWARKLRTFLNLSGIVISCVLLLSTLAAATGIRESILSFVENSHEARRFRVAPSYDRTKMPPEGTIDLEFSASERRLKRLENNLASNWREANLPRPTFIEDTQFLALRELTHVLDVAPSKILSGVLVEDESLAERESSDGEGGDFLSRQRFGGPVSISGVSYQEVAMRERVIAGNFLRPEKPQGALIHELLAYKLGFRSDDDLQQLVGSSITLQFRRQAQNQDGLQSFVLRLNQEKQHVLSEALDALSKGKLELKPEALALFQDFVRESQASKETLKADDQAGGASPFFEQRLEVVGVLRSADKEDAMSFLSRFLGEGNLLIHHQLLSKVSDTLGPTRYRTATVYIDEVQYLSEVTEAAEKLNLVVFSPTSSLENIFQEIEKSEASLLIVVAIILLVAAIGISNTMIMSVVERAEEIAIMKAVGASNRQVSALILFEGLTTGLIGGLLAVGCVYTIASVASHFIREFVETKINATLDENVFLIQPWMLLATLAVATGVAALAALVPARKAAKLDPVKAMGR